MDFITCLLKSKKQNGSIFAVVEKLSKVAHFFLVKSTYKAVHIIDICLKETFRLHGIPKAIISDRDTKFTNNLWISLFSGLKTQLKFSIAYHPWVDEMSKSNLGGYA